MLRRSISDAKLTRTNSCSLSSRDPLQGQSRLKNASQKSTLEQEVEYVLRMYLFFELDLSAFTTV